MTLPKRLQNHLKQASARILAWPIFRQRQNTRHLPSHLENPLAFGKLQCKGYFLSNICLRTRQLLKKTTTNFPLKTDTAVFAPILQLLWVRGRDQVPATPAFTGWFMKIQGRNHILKAFALSCLMGLATQACTNNSIRQLSSTNPTKLLNGTDSTPVASTSSPVTVSKVLRSNIDPVANFDVVGDGSGALGRFCEADDTQENGAGGSDSSNGSGASSACTCELNYFRADGSNDLVEVPVGYVESDLVRCNYSVIPNDIPFARVRLHLIASDVYSNEVVFRFSGGGPVLNLSDSTSFVSPRRYQCRDRVFIPHLLDGTVYDPIQSEDPEYSTPINFYASNLGGAFAAFGASTFNAMDPWDCPGNPNDNTQGINLTLLSETPDQNGSNTIFPPAAGTFDRSTFFLAKKSTGVFSVALNGLLAPNTVTASPDSNGKQTAGTAPPFGYGVAPIPTGLGERCPSDLEVTRPKGFHWVKVWQYRASLPARRALTSNKLKPSYSGFTVACNPGAWEIQREQTQVQPLLFGDCSFNPEINVGDDAAAKVALRAMSNGLSDNGTLADRVIQIGKTGGVQIKCVAMNDALDSPEGTIKPLTESGAGKMPGGLGADVWMVRDNFPAKCNAGFVDLPEVCSGLTGDLSKDSTGRFNVTGDRAPQFIELDVTDPSQVSGSSRYDFVYIATPTSVMVSDMKDPESDKALPYRPYRYLAGNCAGTEEECKNKKITYNFKEHSITSNGDAPDNTSGRKPIFPVCALQPDGGT